jgi:putative NADH-flavin reductase
MNGFDAVAFHFYNLCQKNATNQIATCKISLVAFPFTKLKKLCHFQNLREKTNKLGFFQVLRTNNKIVSKTLILGGGGSLEVYNSRHETALVKMGSVSLFFLQI